MSVQDFKDALGTEAMALAEGNEINFFLHCHLRDYDHVGTGKNLDANYYDKYGSPVYLGDAWTEGYYMVEKALTKHSKIMLNKEVGFPLVAGFGGGAHLYKEHHKKPLHSVDPWNWTGWVPLQKSWVSPGPCNMVKHTNRSFLTLRGNEIQNDLWDYDPFDEEKLTKDHWVYDPLVPTDAYRGGYWFKKNPWGRYLHIFALKSFDENPSDVKRYNYIVHPRAYEATLNTLPDSSLDGIQWVIINAPFEKHFVGTGRKWGNCINGMEIFNDFTYFFSYQPHNGYSSCNGELYNGKELALTWFDTYPLEYCEFLLENALTRGTYLQIISANDAFYERDIIPPNFVQQVVPSLYEKYEERQNVLLSDPKGEMVRSIILKAGNFSIEKYNFLKTKYEEILFEKAKINNYVKLAIDFLKTRPYGMKSVFGYTSLIDTKKTLSRKVFPLDLEYPERLDTCDDVMLDYLTRGRFFSHTGVFDIFDYTKDVSMTIPYIIEGQADKDELCYTIKTSMELKFTFQHTKEKETKPIWRYSLEQNKDNERELVVGYFLLDPNYVTVLDLSTRYNKANLKWIRFTAFDPANPMKRAWFSPINGPMFKTIKKIDLPKLTNRIAKTTSSVQGAKIIYQEDATPFTPIAVLNNKEKCMKFDLPKVKSIDEEKQLYAYFGQGNTRQAEINEDTKNAGRVPPRIPQNIQGYFPLSSLFPTFLDMSNTWDSDTIDKIYFYGVDNKAQLFTIDAK